jgi:hypothetical protein
MQSFEGDMGRHGKCHKDSNRCDNEIGGYKSLIIKQIIMSRTLTLMHSRPPFSQSKLHNGIVPTHEAACHGKMPLRSELIEEGILDEPYVVVRRG